MFKNLIRGFLTVVALRALDRYRQLSVQFLKIEAARGYVHGVRLARLSAIGLMRMGLMIGLIGIGALLLHAGLLILLPWSLKAKALLGIVLGLVYAGIGCAALHAALKEKTWMEKSGAADVLQQATGQPEPGPDQR